MTTAPTNPSLCPTCGQPLPHAPPKRGRRYTRAEAPPTSIPARLRDLYGDGRSFAIDDAARDLGESIDTVGKTLRRMKDAARLPALIQTESGQWVGEWRLTTPTP
jgi:hypothetical protein